MASITDYYASGTSSGERADEREERIGIVAGWAGSVTGEVIDIGCSDGRLARLLRGPNRRVTGVDVNPVLLAGARTILDDTASFDITQPWPFPDGFAAAIHMGAVVEHVFDYRMLFGEASRVLRSAGLLWISTPNAACLRHRIEVALGKMPLWYTNYEHIRPWTVSFLDAQLRPLLLDRTRLQGAHVRSTRLHRVISRFVPRMSSIIVAEYAKR